MFKLDSPINVAFGTVARFPSEIGSSQLVQRAVVGLNASAERLIALTSGDPAAGAYLAATRTRMREMDGLVIAAATSKTRPTREFASRANLSPFAPSMN